MRWLGLFLLSIGALWLGIRFDIEAFIPMNLVMIGSSMWTYCNKDED